MMQNAHWVIWVRKKQVEKKRHMLTAKYLRIKVKNYVQNHQEPFSLQLHHFPELQPTRSLQKLSGS